MSEETKKPDPAWLHECGDWVDLGAREFRYSLDKLRAKFEVRELPGGWLVLNHESKYGNWKYFAALRFASSETDSKNEIDDLVFHGEGPGGKRGESLRECRHTWWGEGGYIFYPDGVLIAAAFKLLAEFYDDMVGE